MRGTRCQINRSIPPSVVQHWTARQASTDQTRSLLAQTTFVKRGLLSWPQSHTTSLRSRSSAALTSSTVPLEHGRVCLRKGRWKIVHIPLGRPTRAGKWQLYDSVKDQGEIHDLGDAEPEKLAGMVVCWKIPHHQRQRPQRRLDPESATSAKYTRRKPNNRSSFNCVGRESRYTPL